jgi:hypothetical protein
MFKISASTQGIALFDEYSNNYQKLLHDIPVLSVSSRQLKPQHEQFLFQKHCNKNVTLFVFLEKQ